MRKPRIFRQRFIPYEIVDISGDELVYRSSDLIVTRWKAIRPRKDLATGVSFTFLKDGFKVSKFFDAEGSFLYWYCDIIDVSYDEDSDTFTLMDLLVDVKVMPDGKVIVLDAGELADAIEQKLVTEAQACRALRTLEKLLGMAYAGTFPPSECNMDLNRNEAQHE